jgi:hypothetical protein
VLSILLGEREREKWSANDPFERGIWRECLRSFGEREREREREISTRAIDPFGALEWSLHFSLQVLSYAPQTLSFFSLLFFLSVSVCASLSPQTQEYSTVHASYMYAES